MEAIKAFNTVYRRIRFMEIKDWINIVALVLIPIIAVIIGQYLQTRAKKREDKMRIFTTLMNTRAFAWTKESVEALNMIDVVFVNNKKVRTAWANLLDAYTSTEKSEQMANKRMTLKNKLLEEMACSLGYKDKITWETIQNPYIPEIMVKDMQQQEQFKNGQLALAEIVQKMNQAQSTNTEESTEGKK